MRANSPSSAARFAVCLLFAGTLVAACDHATQKTNARTDAGCTPGTELCACLAGNACMGDLVCGSGLCVRLTGVATGVGGSGGGSGGDGGTATGSGGSGSGGSGSGAGGGGTPGTNLVTNGDFSSGEMFWSVIINNGGNADHGVQNGALCVTVSTNQSVTLGWAADMASTLHLPSATSYQLSFRAQASTPLAKFTAKVGLAVDPFTADFEQDDQVGTSFSTFTHRFTTDHADDQTGLAFILQGGGQSSMVCIDDVQLSGAN